METLLRIEKGDVHKITVPAGANSATVWNVYDNAQQTLNSSVAAGAELILGPYVNITNFRIEMVGTVTIAKQGDDFSTPVPFSDYQTPLPPGAAVEDAVDETDIVAQFNALLASLRAASIIETAEE